ncbi:hypothetical protein LL033_26190 (plasmid) [Clostridium estertheticum]|uniref:hypothetical protein n=1 Tax=Clostridium estertheticum TaxID=238834 RepID=UPI001C0AE043|nr:hypothetical protein [Clostridium estertheticum]MBU3218307.1 hypothetical protein [Clostridium estertheticum]WAG58243.1 hypothetical protein LL033_26190 [Clostridium estertheticum]
MLKNKIKSIAIALTVVLGTSIGASVPAFATETSKNTITKTTTGTTTTLDLSTISTTPYNNDMIKESKGLKKTAAVLILKNGGRGIAVIAEKMGNAKFAKLLKDNSLAIGSFLENISDAFESRLVGFMIHELGMPSAAARVITSLICDVLL